MSKKAYARDLTEDEVRWLLDDAFTTIPIDQTIAKFGPEWSRRMLNEWLKDNPNIKKQWEEAFVSACPFLESDLLNTTKKLDPKAASVASANIKTILSARMPEKYSSKVDINLSQTVSIRSNLDKANERIASIMRDVTPSALTDSIKKK